MKNIIFSLLLLPVLALAQEPIIVEKQVVCDKTQTILNSLSKDYAEKPIWLGQASDSRYSIFVSESGAWTIIQFNKDLACIIGAGQSSRQIFLGPSV